MKGLSLYTLAVCGLVLLSHSSTVVWSAGLRRSTTSGGMKKAFVGGSSVASSDAENEESVRFVESSLLEVAEMSKKKKKKGQAVAAKKPAMEDFDFGYKQSSDHTAKGEGGLKIGVAAGSGQGHVTKGRANEARPRFSRTGTSITSGSSARMPPMMGMGGMGMGMGGGMHPGMMMGGGMQHPGMMMMGGGMQHPGMMMGGGMGGASPYGMGSKFGRGPGDYATPFYGHFPRQYGPMGGGPLSENHGMGSFPNTIDPRGFGMQGNLSEPWDLGGTPGFPSFGKQMIEGMPFPTKLAGYDSMHQYGMPPFTGKQFTAMGPFGPYKMNGEDDDAKKGSNTTLMGPRPFGPYGTMSMPMMNGPGAMMQMAPYMGPQMMGGGMMGGGMMGGIGPRYDPAVAWHHAAMMGGGQQTFATPGMIHGSGTGYPHPDFDRYNTVPLSPVPPMGGEAAKAA